MVFAIRVTSNHTDLKIYRSLLMPLVLKRGNYFLIKFGVQYCQITVSIVYEASCGF